MKSIIAAGLLLGCAHGAVAAPYANIENTASFLGEEFGASVTEVHAGYEFDSGLYIQGGPAFLAVDGEEGAVEYSGKVGYATQLNEDLTLYGEVSAITEGKEFEPSELNWGTKVGLTFTF
jgi:hypothetical protein